MTLKTFSKDFSAYKNIKATYMFTDGSGNTLFEAKDLPVIKPTLDISYQVLPNLEGILVFQITYQADEEFVSYKKEF